MRISECLLTSLDGNAIFIGGHHKGLTIEHNEFSLIGDSAIVRSPKPP